MNLNQKATELYSIKDVHFKEELLHFLSVMAEEISDLKGEVQSLQHQIDNHNP